MTGRLTVSLDKQAEDDLYQIYMNRLEHRGPNGPDGAEALLDALQATIDGIADYPERGPIPPELEALGERKWRQVSHPPYRVIYLLEDGAATVALVADSRRDFASLLQGRLLGA